MNILNTIKTIKKQQKYRMSYPAIGKIKGYFTNDEFIRTDNMETTTETTTETDDINILSEETIMSNFYNNHGSPYDLKTNVKTDTKLIEQEVLEQLKTYFNFDNNFYGYITSGGTESNMFSILKIRDYYIDNNK